MAATGEADPEIPSEEVRRRFVWARRQGKPAWLWPETPAAAWRLALEQIGAATAAVLAGEPSARLEGEPQSIGLAGYTSGLGPLLGLWLEQGRLQADGPIQTVLARHLAHNRVRASRMTAAAVELVGRLADDGVPALILKGAHTGPAYFPELGARPASDIDLLVAADDAAAAEAAMVRGGFVLKLRSRWESSWVAPAAASEPRSLTYVHAADPWSIDLHNALKISVGAGMPTADLDRATPTAGAARWTVDPRARVLDQPLLLLHLAAHAGAGWQNLTLLRQVELVLVIRQDLAAGRLSWEGFLEAGARTGALGYAYPALRMAGALAPGAVPDAVLDRCAACAPGAVRRALDRLTPASAQRIDRASVGEHFMWVQDWRGGLRLLLSDLILAGRPWPELRRIYEERAWRLIRGAVSQ